MFGHHGSKAAENMVGRLLSLDLKDKGIAVGMVHVSCFLFCYVSTGLLLFTIVLLVYWYTILLVVDAGVGDSRILLTL